MRNLSLVVLVLGIFVLGGCAHQKQVNFPSSLKDDLTTADKKCTSQHWNNLSDRMSCIDTAEAPIIQKEVPEVYDAYKRFSAQRNKLAEDADQKLAKELETTKMCNQEAMEAGNEFKALHPELADDTDLGKEITAAVDDACPKSPYYENNKCAQSEILPILQNELPDAVPDFKSLMSKRLLLAKKLDSLDKSKRVQKVIADFKQSMNDANAVYLADAKKAFEVAASENKMNEQKADANLKTLGDIAEGVAAVVVVAAAIAAVVVASKHAGGSGGGSCCKVCSIGKACGDTCITIYDVCHVPAGCACNQY